MYRHFIHYGIHFLVPVLIVFIFFKENRLKALLILWAGMIIDVDHFLANPLFDPNRCSIGFHPLHSYWAIFGYFILLCVKPTRIIGLALIIHIFADFMDCLLI
ncbi:MULTISPECIES: DUF6122 family protein [Flavobacteriaceae]|uniref:DUF6122 family protein n=1 Tax=Flavobacteriaceae TaxID=49546 RepID=UPI001FE75BEF|nr:MULTISPECIES: DUF6122 family protein [Allomuricauda]MDC6367581.1 DUF6122 family protein [Muricauda sp. AC10]